MMKLPVVAKQENVKPHNPSFQKSKTPFSHANQHINIVHHLKKHQVWYIEILSISSRDKKCRRLINDGKNTIGDVPQNCEKS